MSTQGDRIILSGVKRLSFHCFIFILAALFLLSGLRVAEAASVRELRVGVAVTPSYKADREWKQKFEKHLAYASQIFSRETGLSFRPVAYMDWIPSQESDMGTLFEDLKGKFPLNNVDLILGLSGSRPSQISSPNDPEIIGRTRPFSGYLVLRRPPEGLFNVQEETVLVHELGHLFGAIHVEGKNSVMSPVIDRQIPMSFDSVNRDLISAARSIDFKKGEAGLDEKLAQRLLQSYRKVVYEGQPFEYYYALGNLYLRLGQGKEALESLEKAAQLDDQSALLHYDMGVLSFKLGKLEDSISHLDKAIQLFHDPGEAGRRAEALHMLGSAHFMKQSYEAARRFWSEAASLKPDNLDLKVNLGVVQMKLGKPREAIQALERAVQSGSRNATAFGSLGSAYFELGDYGRSADYFERAIKAGSDSFGSALVWDSTPPAALYAKLAQAYLKLNRQTEAVARFEASCQLDPSPSCHRQLGQLYFEMRRWDEAIRELKGVLNAYRTDADIYGMLAASFAQKGNNEKALAIFQEGVKQAKDRLTQALFYTNIGDLYLRANRSDLAVGEFLKAIDRNWSNPDAHAGLAVAYLNQNQVENARQSIRHALTLNPNHATAKQILARLGESG